MTHKEAAQIITALYMREHIVMPGWALEEEIQKFYYAHHERPIEEACAECGLFDAHTSNCVKREEEA